MTPDNASTPKSRGWLRALLMLFIAFDAAVFFQWAGGAFESELGGHRDEAAHFLAGLRVRESITRTQSYAGSATLNVSREEEIADSRSWGISPVLGGWMAVFGATRTAALMFMAALAAATAALIFSTVRRELGDTAATAAALVWLCAPAVRESFSTILPGQLYALAAALLLWAHARSPRKPRSVALQSCAEPCPQTNPPGGSNQTAARAPRLIRHVPLFVIAGMLALDGTGALALAPTDTLAASRFLQDCVLAPGIAVAAFALVGIAVSLRSNMGESVLWSSAAAFAAGVLVARWLKAGDADTRTLVVALPALAMLAVRGAVWLAGAVSRRAETAAVLLRRRQLWLFLLLLLALPMDLVAHRRKEWHGFSPVARTLLDEARGNVRVLVVSDLLGEGMLVAELAVLDLEPKVTIERGSTTLARPPDASSHGKPAQRFLDDEQLFAHLISGHIRYIVLDSAVPQDVRAGYHDQILRVLEGNVRSFWPIYDSPIIRDGEPMGHPLRVFRVHRSDGVQLE